jgi:dynein heavy chain, axonemal
MQEAGNLKVLNFGDNNFIQNLEFAIKFGKKVLIENIGEKVDLVLYPLIKREFSTEAG